MSDRDRPEPNGGGTDVRSEPTNDDTTTKPMNPPPTIAARGDPGARRTPSKTETLECYEVLSKWSKEELRVISTSPEFAHHQRTGAYGFEHALERRYFQDGKLPMYLVVRANANGYNRGKYPQLVAAEESLIARHKGDMRIARDAIVAVVKAYPATKRTVREKHPWLIGPEGATQVVEYKLV